MIKLYLKFVSKVQYYNKNLKNNINSPIILNSDIQVKKANSLTIRADKLRII